MRADKSQDADKFDRVLRNNLRKYREPVRADFTGKVLKQLTTLQEQKILARIVLEERLVLAGCISLFVIIVTAIIYFGRDILRVLDLLANDLKETLINTSTAYSPDWQLILVITVTAGLVLYCFSDNLQLKQLARRILSS